MMYLLADSYIFYADIYFLQNFIIKTAVIYLSLCFNKIHCSIYTLKGIGKIMLASFLGTGIEVMGLMMGNSYHFFLVLVHLLEIPFMMRVVLGKRQRQMLRVIITGYFFVIVINGVLEILWNWFGQHGLYILLLCGACGAVAIGVRIWQNYNRMKKGIFSIEILHQGKCIQTYGLYDTGNCLKDPYTGKGVHIISEKLLSQFSMQNQKEVYIPYQSLGNEQGLIKVYYLEHIRIQKDYEFLEKNAVPVGVAEEKLFQNKNYQMILNEEIG